MPGKWVVQKVGPNSVQLRGEDGEIKEAYFNQIRGVRTVDDQMLQEAQQNSNDEIQLIPVEEAAPPENLDEQVKMYELNHQAIQDNLNQEVAKRIQDRAEMDLSLGFQPQTQVETLLAMQDKAKKKVEEDLNKYTVGAKAYNRVLTPEQIQEITYKMLDGEYGPNGFRGFTQNLPKTISDERYVYNEPELSGAKRLRDKLIRQRKAQLEKINPVVARPQYGLFFED
jgi:predicted transcriptional regulator YdeE